MRFVPSEEHAQLREVARRLASRLTDGAVARDREGAFPRDMLALLASAGLLGLNVPVENGGQGAGELASGFVIEELSKADVSAGHLVLQANISGRLLSSFATAPVRERWLPALLGGETTIAFAITEPQAGSDVSAVSMTARRGPGGWLLRGEKPSVSFVESQAAWVLARAEGVGLTFFFVPLGTHGITVAPFDDLGCRQQGRAVVTFDDAFVPDDHVLGEPGSGLRSVLGALAISKVLASCSAIGAAQAALDDAVAWSCDRVTFGAPLATRQGIAFPLVDLRTELEAARLLAHKALWLADQGLDFTREAAMAKAWIPGLAVRICHEALLVVGHVAYSREHPAQVRLRDVIGIELGEGPANSQRRIVARQLFGAAAS